VPYLLALARCAELRTLNLARNQLQGKIPESFKNFSSLSYLSLTGNNFTNLSSALQVLQDLPKLTSLVLTKNFHGGEMMPVDGIKGFKSMQVLVLANCALSGVIPPWLQSLESLNVLDISWNKLHGNIPPWLGNLNNLFYIDLSNNSFTGELPESFTRMRGLISSNGSSEQESTMYLPLFFKKKSAGKGLQYNQFSTFPPSLIVSNNLLAGPVLPGLGHLVKLHVLDLSGNKFSGEIPDELSNMSNLEVLNLAHNDLNGSIPSSLTELNFLSQFDVSYNNLAGDIPAGGQFSTFPNEDFVGNSALCLLWNTSCSLVVETEDEQQSDTDITIPAMTYITVEVGFAFGLLTIWNILFFARAWRAAYFLAVDRFFDTIYVMVVVKVNKLKRSWGDTAHS
jgi:Leucine-rich repeat (LRR) protein